MNEEEKKAIKIVNSLKEWGKIHFIVKNRSYARLTYNEVYLLLNLIEKLQKENEELKNNTRKNENELEFDIDCDWIALQKMLDESEKSNEYISYKNEKWIKEKYCIPIQKVKDKIEELNRKIDKSIDNSKGGLDEEFIEKAGELLIQKRILQELLEKE